MEPTCAFQERLGYTFLDPALLHEALTHESHHNEHPGPVRNPGGRLAFLGDGVLSLAVASELMRQEGGKGKFTEERARQVKNAHLASVAAKLDLPLAMGKGEERNDEGRTRRLASALEAVLGAVYLAAGPAHAIRVTNHLLRRHASGE